MDNTESVLSIAGSGFGKRVLIMTIFPHSQKTKMTSRVLEFSAWESSI